MSDEQRITKVAKEKDPRRVEAGKRLGAMSRAAKERKAREREDREKHDDDRQSDGGGVGIVTLLTGVGVLSGLVCLYYTYKQDKRAERVEQVEVPTDNNRVPQKRSTDTTKSKLRSFDD